MPLKQDPQGLVPAIAQDISTGQVLMLGYMSPGALKRTLEGKDVWFFSRSQEDMWHKGEVSGNYMKLRKAWQDCDGDTLLLQVEPTGPICHTGNKGCFFTPVTELPEFKPADRSGAAVLEDVFRVIRDRQRDLPEGSYTAELLKAGTPRVAQKVIEEAGEAALAAATGDQGNLPGELADLFYHALVLLASTGVKPEAVWTELKKRHAAQRPAQAT